MVCSFFYRMIPIWICMALYWLYRHATGKNDETEAAKNGEDVAKNAADAAGEKMESLCPYMMFCRFFGISDEPPKKVVDEGDGSKESKDNQTQQSTDKGIKAE